MSQLQEDSYNALLTMMEHVNAGLELTTAIPHIPFEQMDPESWEALQNAMVGMTEILVAFKMCVQAGGQIVADEELLQKAHDTVEIPPRPEI